jgi:hypothetical protein
MEHIAGYTATLLSVSGRQHLGLNGLNPWYVSVKMLLKYFVYPADYSPAS